MCFDSFFDQFCVKKGRFQSFVVPEVASTYIITETQQVKIEIETSSREMDIENCNSDLVVLAVFVPQSLSIRVHDLWYNTLIK